MTTYTQVRRTQDAVSVNTTLTEEFLMVDVEQKRRKLSILHHAAHCRYEHIGDCGRQQYCCAAKRVFQHMIGCSRDDCNVPGCRKCRSVWRHYRKCQDRNCVVCSVVPTRYSSKGISHRFMNMISHSSEDSVVSADASLNTVGSMSVLSGKRGRRRKDVVGGGPPRSGGKENSSTDVSMNSRGYQDKSSVQTGEQTVKTRPPMSPRQPIWALY